MCWELEPNPAAKRHAHTFCLHLIVYETPPKMGWHLKKLLTEGVPITPDTLSVGDRFQNTPTGLLN